MSTPSVHDVTAVLETIAPLTGAESWDNVGLLIGSPAWDAASIMFTIDLTEDVLDEAIARGVNLLVAYHPPIFDPLKRLTDAAEKQRIVLRAARADLAVYSPHTALDAAENGLTDWLVSGLGSGDVRALTPYSAVAGGAECKIVTFAPRDAVERIRATLATIGAGNIGDYQLCSFETPGTGTFRGAEGTSPVVGTAGQLERVPEIRLEMVCPEKCLGLAITAIRQVHPYEEAPIDVIRLEPQPERAIGGGRKLTLDQPATLQDVVTRAKETMGVEHVRVARPRKAPERHSVIGACAGAGGSMVDSAIAQGCDLFLTGEMRHHDVMAAIARGCTLILPGHTNTERGYLPHLRQRMIDGLAAAGVDIAADRLLISERDRASFSVE
ncbi:MAG: Nif3-like dinuclear metal center hexameric protein [Phycisphaerales bacterium]